MGQRYKFLDGLRGVAILWVLLFHTFTRWADLLRFDDSFDRVGLVAAGHFGVQLFFMISGYVIYMSLEKSRDIRDFLLRRWLRLFPAMLIATLLLYSTSFLLPERPLGLARLADAIPGLLFVEPELISRLAGTGIRSLDGAFWSLYVEVKFYLLVSILYFGAGRRAVILGVPACYISLLAAQALLERAPGSVALQQAVVILQSFSFEHFSWFAVGILFYEYRFRNAAGIWGGMIPVLFGIFAVASYSGPKASQGVWTFLTFLLFALPQFSDAAAKLLANRVMLFFGYVSYPLYLIHQNLSIGIIRKFNVVYPMVPDAVVVPATLLAVILVSWLIAHHLEGRVKQVLAGLVNALVRRRLPV